MAGFLSKLRRIHHSVYTGPSCSDEVWGEPGVSDHYHSLDQDYVLLGRFYEIIRCSFFCKQEALGFAPFGYYGLGTAPFSYCALLASQVRLPNALPHIKVLPFD
nr:PREDICTED: uncharacterized protein LOC108951738 [Musa acuminata subsp. malaccensis]